MKKLIDKMQTRIFLFLFIIIVFVFFWKGNSITFYKIILPLIGITLVISGIVYLLKTKRNLQNSSLIDGVVIDLIEETDNDGYHTYYPLIEYFNEQLGEKSIYKSRNGYLRSKFKVGQNIELLLCRNENETVIYINTRFDIWGFSFLSILFGLASLLIGLIICLTK